MSVSLARLEAWEQRIDADERLLEQRESELHADPKRLKAARKRLQIRRARLNKKYSAWLRAAANDALMNWEMEKLRADIIMALHG